MRRKAETRLHERKYKNRVRITVGSATCENAAGANEVATRLADLIQRHGGKDVSMGRVGCTGKCDMEPVVTVMGLQTVPNKYIKMTPDKVEKVFEQHIVGGKPVTDCL